MSELHYPTYSLARGGAVISVNYLLICLLSSSKNNCIHIITLFDN